MHSFPDRGVELWSADRCCVPCRSTLNVDYTNNYVSVGFPEGCWTKGNKYVEPYASAYWASSDEIRSATDFVDGLADFYPNP